MNDMTTVEITFDVATMPKGDALLAVFTTDGAIDPLLNRIRAEIDAFVPDLTTATGRKAIASMAYKVAQSKTRIDDAGKELVAEQKKIPNKIDATRKIIRATRPACHDEVRAPLTDWENQEKARVEKHKAKIAWFNLRANENADLDLSELTANLAEVQSFVIDDECEEFISEYTMAKVQAEASLMTAIIKREKYEAEQAELEKLRKEAAARQQRDHEEKIAREAADKAKLDAEAKAEAERKAAEDVTKREREAAERRELELKLQAEQAERRAVEAEAKAKRDAEAKAQAERIEVERREADKAHRAKINSEIVAAIVAHGVDESTAKQVVTLIAKKELPHVSIHY